MEHMYIETRKFKSRNVSSACGHLLQVIVLNASLNRHAPYLPSCLLGVWITLPAQVEARADFRAVHGLLGAQLSFLYPKIYPHATKALSKETYIHATSVPTVI